MGIPRFLRYLLSDKLSPCVQILHTHSSSHVEGERSTTLLFSRKKWRCGPLIHPWRLKMIHMWHAVVGCFFPAFVQLHLDWRWPFLFIWNKKDSMKTMQVMIRCLMQCISLGYFFPQSVLSMRDVCQGERNICGRCPLG